jgi:hypothetical protein
MLTQFVNQIEHHPESLFVQAEIVARIKRDTVSAVTGWFHPIRAFWRRFRVHHQPVTGRNDRVQRGRVERGWRETFHRSSI